jgi:hypothetical protein
LATFAKNGGGSVGIVRLRTEATEVLNDFENLSDEETNEIDKFKP